MIVDFEELFRGSNFRPTSENLVPIRLDIEVDDQRLKDAFTWNPRGIIFSAVALSFLVIKLFKIIVLIFSGVFCVGLQILTPKSSILLEERLKILNCRQLS